MFNAALLRVVTSNTFLGAVDVFAQIQKGGQLLSKNLYIIAPIIFVVSLAGGGIAFSFGRSGAEKGKSHIWNVLFGAFLFLAAASFIVSAFTLFGVRAQGI